MHTYIHIFVSFLSTSSISLFNLTKEIRERLHSILNFVQVLSTDEFWPAQGGKVPDISQVREAIDAILCSQRDMSSNSNN